MSNPNLYEISASAINLSGAERDLLNLLIRVWSNHLDSNLRNLAYYNGAQPLYESTGDMPEQLKHFRAVCGWPAKAVDMLAGRSVLRGFISDGESAELINSVVQGNNICDLYRQSLTSELVYSCSFLTVSKGMPGEPEVLVSAYPASAASAIWDERRKRIRAGLAVIDVTTDASGHSKPSWLNMYTDDYTYMMRRANNGRWIVDKVENPLGRPLMEPLRYRPTLDRPFGKSRISAAVRSITREAILCVTNEAIASCFYAWPQRYLLGVDRKTAENLADNKMKTYVDRMILVTPNKNGDVPEYGQLAQMSMQPYDDYLQTLAKRFSGETSIPVSSLGITFDNPSSAESLYALENDLIVESELLNANNGYALRQVALMILCQLHGTDFSGLTEEDLSIKADFENPQRPSMAARADYAIKIASAVPEYAQTDDFWRELGFDESRISSLRRQMRYTQATQLLSQIQLQQPAQTETQQQPAEEAEVVEATADVTA